MSARAAARADRLRRARHNLAHRAKPSVRQRRSEPHSLILPPLRDAAPAHRVSTQTSSTEEVSLSKIDLNKGAPLDVVPPPEPKEPPALQRACDQEARTTKEAMLDPAKLRSLFDRFDIDGSGSVSVDEVEQMAEELGLVMDHEALASMVRVVTLASCPKCLAEMVVPGCIPHLYVDVYMH